MVALSSLRSICVPTRRKGVPGQCCGTRKTSVSGYARGRRRSYSSVPAVSMMEREQICPSGVFISGAYEPKCSASGTHLLFVQAYRSVVFPTASSPTGKHLICFITSCYLLHYHLLSAGFCRLQSSSEKQRGKVAAALVFSKHAPPQMGSLTPERKRCPRQ